MSIDRGNKRKRSENILVGMDQWSIHFSNGIVARYGKDNMTLRLIL
uniref:Uncharacterized protein n=1 Tax=Arundo donax TaxID=35708 RepID=A0A0A9B0Z2_ARUDO